MMDETTADVGWFNKNLSNSSATNTPNPEGSLPFYDDTSNYYDMNGEKLFIIFNHNQYKKTKYFDYKQYSPRNGTFNDVKSLKETFGGLGFKVIVHNDLDHDAILDEISEVCRAEHKSTSCIAVAILTHGEAGGEVCAADRPYNLSDVTNMMLYAANLAGKPKLFFVQACRGGLMDDGQKIELDGEGRASITIPTHADCLVLYSSFEEHLSYRDRDGSWMVQALCKVIDEHHQELELLQLVTLVNRSVAGRVTFTPRDGNTNNKKQIPETRFTLTKFLKL